MYCRSTCPWSVPTFNESRNVRELLCRLEATLGATGWEVIFVDDDSPDGTATEVCNIARIAPRVRCLQRVGRRGLASACIVRACLWLHKGYLEKIAWSIPIDFYAFS
jgi:glycosyltransferase involved in cell wall biosynthesis